MPSIEITDPYRYVKRIDSSDPELLAKWLWEVVSTRSNGLESDPPLQLRIRPGWIDRPGGQPVPDWSPDTRLLDNWSLPMNGRDTPYKRAQEMIKALTELADQFADEG